VVIVAEVLDGSRDGLAETDVERERLNLTRDMGGTYFDHLLADLVSRASIERRKPGEQTLE
jgi:hypothetical protein